MIPTILILFVLVRAYPEVDRLGSVHKEVPNTSHVGMCHLFPCIKDNRVVVIVRFHFLKLVNCVVRMLQFLLPGL